MHIYESTMLEVVLMVIHARHWVSLFGKHWILPVQHTVHFMISLQMSLFSSGFIHEG